ncbi:beta-1,3-galactosyltransferase 6-like [Dysidea avara]|uniref:beta-1,3-galactosyltransferase 6-like n=1 Tax=Dysidea avara TaxID=196820 RepID=UPI00331D313F
MKLSATSCVLIVAIVLLYISIRYAPHSLYKRRQVTVEPTGVPCNCSKLTTIGVASHPIASSTAVAQIKKKLGPTFLLILVPIRPQALEQRTLIRTTWYKGFSDSKDVMLRYLMGSKGLNASDISRLHDENRQYKDLVFMEDFEEGIRVLTNKTALLFKWAYENVDYTYLMKCDDDSFVYVHNTIIELRKRQTTGRLYYGVMVFNTAPILDPKDKWKDTTWDLAKTYLPYARGGCYILSADLIMLIAKEFHHLKWHLNEDVSVGSWLAGFDYERRDDDLFCYISYTTNFHPCRKDHRVAHLFYGQPWPKLQRLFHELQSQMPVVQSKNT